MAFGEATLDDSALFTELPESISATIQGEISGQIAVGNRILQIGSIYGGVVTINSSEDQPQAKARSAPILLRPRPFPSLIGREPEVMATLTVLHSSLSVEFQGASGIGKTSLLRYLAYHSEIAARFPDGIIYLSARCKPGIDLLQALFDAFYESSAAFKPIEADIHHALQSKRALVLLDDVRLTREDLEVVMNGAPHCSFLLSSEEQHLWGEGQVIALRGLPPEKITVLMEHDLGRSLQPEEKLAAHVMSLTLEGHPLKLLQTLSLVKQGVHSLVEIAHRLQFPEQSVAQATDDSIVVEVEATSSESEKRVLSVLAVLGGIGLLAQQIGTIAELPNIGKTLEALQQRNLIQVDGDRYSINDALVKALQQTWDLTPWLNQVLAYFTTLAEQCRSLPKRLLEEADTLLQLLRTAAAAGLWAAVLQLGKLVENAFALNKYWGSWKQILELCLQAAQKLGQRAAEALMLHQLGTRALCLADISTAKAALSRAIEIREALGDRMGAAISRHNLGLLGIIIASAAVGTVVGTTASSATGASAVSASSIGTGVSTSAANVGATVTGIGATGGVIPAGATAAAVPIAGAAVIGTTAAAGAASTIGIPALIATGAVTMLLTAGAVIGVNKWISTVPDPSPSPPTATPSPSLSPPTSPSISKSPNPGGGTGNPSPSGTSLSPHANPSPPSSGAITNPTQSPAGEQAKPTTPSVSQPGNQDTIYSDDPSPDPNQETVYSDPLSDPEPTSIETPSTNSGYQQRQQSGGSNYQPPFDSNYQTPVDPGYQPTDQPSVDSGYQSTDQGAYADPPASP